MNCEEFEAIGLDAERDASLTAAERAAAREHASSCSHCVALQDSWQAARVELRALREATGEAQAPARVEMRLRQEFLTQHRTLKVRRAAVVAAWVLATAAILIGAVSWNTWRKIQQEEATRHLASPGSAGNLTAGDSGNALKHETPMQGAVGFERQNSAADESSPALVASNELSGFTLLPGILPADLDDAAILTVRMQRGALGALGLPVDEERAGDWIQVDLLVGNDGLPQAVRLPE